MLAMVQFQADPNGMAGPGERYALVTSGSIAPRLEQVDIPIVAGFGVYVAPLAPDAIPAAQDVVLVCWQGALLAGRWRGSTTRSYLLAGSDAGRPVQLPRYSTRLVGVVGGVDIPWPLVDALWTPELRAAYWAQPEDRRKSRWIV